MEHMKRGFGIGSADHHFESDPRNVKFVYILKIDKYQFTKLTNLFAGNCSGVFFFRESVCFR